MPRPFQQLRFASVGAPPMKAIVLCAAIAVATTTLSHPAMAQNGPCTQLSHERNDYTVCEVDLRKDAVRLYWRRPDGSPYAYLRSLPRSLDAKAGELLFATNAGMFDPSYRPVGLYVEQGQELVRANTRSGYGNFHMKPNGVFYVADNMAGVLETSTYLKLRPQADFATQSGPMLVINGRLHPNLHRPRASLKPRHGLRTRTPPPPAFATSHPDPSSARFAH